MKNKISLIICVFTSIFFYIIFYKGINNSNIYSPSKNVEKNIPSFQAKTFNMNRMIDSKEIFKKNKYYILNVWSSWCVPCKEEHPILIKLSQEQSLEIIGLNYKDKRNNADSFLKKLGNPYSEILVDTKGVIAIEWGAYGVPETFLIDKNKKIIRKYIGPLNNELLNEIKNFIK